MFGCIYNKPLGGGYLILTNRTFVKADLDALIGLSVSDIKSMSFSLAYTTFDSVQITEKSRAINASSSVNSQVPRYGKASFVTITGLVSTTTSIKSGSILGGILVVGDPATNIGFLTYGQYGEIYGTHEFIALGSPEASITQTNLTSYYVD